MPPYMRRSPKVAEMLPILYLRSTDSPPGDFRPTLEGLLGADAPVCRRPTSSDLPLAGSKNTGAPTRSSTLLRSKNHRCSPASRQGSSHHKEGTHTPTSSFGDSASTARSQRDHS